MAGYIIDENKNLLKDAEAINSLYGNAPDNPVVLWTKIDLWIDYINTFLQGLSDLMRKYIANTSLDLNDKSTRLDLYADWVNVYMTAVSNINSSMQYSSQCLSYYK